MIKSSVRWIISLYLLSASTSHAGAKLVKSYDGRKAYCGHSTTVTETASKIIQMELLNHHSTENMVQVQIAVTLVKCDGARWGVDSNPSQASYKIVGADGSLLNVKEKFREAHLNILTDERVFLAQINLDQLFNLGRQTIEFNIPKSVIVNRQLQLTVLANKKFSVSNGYSDELPVTFGSFHLNLF